ncbi:pantothenate kinase [Pseudorhizobium tarimense]|uniref:Pantothenate kinase n=1 Tax=Pseudorhizobium tarimense TaxID=1079109 RepID=A0ABV2H8U2_9HYPH|nr:nucleoside triphosphate hydrolase [Pseudorhizobium tarimense]MCJ8520060.1 nucleoside triphosphate hydrolase [Pseudorhizobium tarimense]
MMARSGEIADEIVRRAGDAKRFIVAIAGPPGSGKSTFAEEVASHLRAKGENAAIVPMDGFHMDDAVLRDKGLLKRKGAPQTFDVRGLLDVVKALQRADQEVLVPLFDRSRELSVAAARAIPSNTRLVLIEGNYLLLEEQPWAGLACLLNLSVLLMPAEEVLEERLMRRWLDLGMTGEEARRKVEENDLPNGRLVRTKSRDADLVLN